MAFSTGYDMQEEFKFSDGLGKTYLAIALVWSVILACGSIFLVKHRDLPFLTIRNVPLTISTTAILHVYWILCLVAYGLNGFFPCATEYWIMNIYLPLGIALFHLSNTKILEVSVLQRKYVSSDLSLDEKEDLSTQLHGWKAHIHRLGVYNAYERAKWLIAFGLLAQFGCALVIFLISRKFHSGFGLVGTVLPDGPETKRECRKGWEWVLSIIWQFLWSWIYAPYLLWKVRNIQDTHGWRMQTLVCCLASLPASPMWLLALYLPQMSILSLYFIPPMWFVPSILLIEGFMVFQPCWQVLKHRRLKNETLEIIAQWENQKLGSSIDSGTTNVSQSPRRITQKSSTLNSTNSRKAHPHMYTMAALEKALQANSTPLLLFAALKDFSGENISFLNHVRDWKKSWGNQRSSILRIGEDVHLRHRQFVRAIEIYSSFVSLRYSTFPINISHSHLKELEVIFEKPASIVNVDNRDSLNSATPFDDFAVRPDDAELERGKGALSMTTTAVDTTSNSTEDEFKVASKQSTIVNMYKAKELSEKIPQHLLIPATFDPSTFDHAADSVKYMVLTNTWPKFVDAGYAANIDKATAIEKFQGRLSECGIGRSRICSF